MTNFGRLVVLLFILIFAAILDFNRTTDSNPTITLEEFLSINPLQEVIEVEIKDFLVKVDPEELECLQKNVYFEAGNQSRRGKEAVALVTLNRIRANHYPDNVCDVVYQRKQFSWTFLKKNHNPKLNNVLEKKQWEVSGEVAMAALRGEVENFLGNSTHYHATYVNPSWASSSRMMNVAKIDTHIFYVDTKLKFSNAEG